MKNFLLLILLLSQLSFSNIIIVDQNGIGDYTTIQEGIDAAVEKDTVKVYPGTYEEQIILIKEIVLMGSGYENTIITSSVDPTIKMSKGIIQWFTITSMGGDGIAISGGTIKNCVINSCAKVGIYMPEGFASVINTIIVNSGSAGIFVDKGTLNVTNSISQFNAGYGFARSRYSGGHLNLSYSNGATSYTYGNQGVINQNPLFFSSTDFRIPPHSPSWDTGNPTLKDPDGSRSDMGYFGGPDAPIYPTVFEIIIEPSGNNIKLKAKARANY